MHFLKSSFLTILFFVITFNINEKYSAQVLFDVSLKDYTTFKVGGNAAVFLSPSDLQSLTSLMDLAKKSNGKIFVLGGGSNVVVPDEGFDGIVISTLKLNKISLTEEGLVCECGASMHDILDFCIEHSLTGLEKFAGLPGTCGGAAFMNARCYEKSISDVLLAVKYYADGKIIDYKMDKADWSYKKSPFQGDLNNDSKPLVLSVTFDVRKGDKSEIAGQAEKYIRDREEKGHFRFPSAGSVFKNNHDFGKPSGKIIDECGLRGLTSGGAQIAPWHGNFIINKDNASASDIRKLVEEVKKTVREKTGFELECEIIFL